LYKEIKGSPAGGSQRAENSWEPMCCAFATTPFPGEDWFILRLVKKDPDLVGIGFCPDYGEQDPRGNKHKPYTERRKEL
jgi:hypothetical protein